MKILLSPLFLLSISTVLAQRRYDRKEPVYYQVDSNPEYTSLYTKPRVSPGLADRFQYFQGGGLRSAGKMAQSGVYEEAQPELYTGPMEGDGQYLERFSFQAPLGEELTMVEEMPTITLTEEPWTLSETFEEESEILGPDPNPYGTLASPIITGSGLATSVKRIVDSGQPLDPIATTEALQSRANANQMNDLAIIISTPGFMERAFSGYYKLDLRFQRMLPPTEELKQALCTSPHLSKTTREEQCKVQRGKKGGGKGRRGKRILM